MYWFFNLPVWRKLIQKPQKCYIPFIIMRQIWRRAVMMIYLNHSVSTIYCIHYMQASHLMLEIFHRIVVIFSMVLFFCQTPRSLTIIIYRMLLSLWKLLGLIYIRKDKQQYICWRRIYWWGNRLYKSENFPHSHSYYILFYF